MLKRMDDMPTGTIGFTAVGEVEDDDWEDAVEPLLRQRIAADEKVRLLYLVGPEATDVEGDAMKADAGFRARHTGAFERVAIVTDESWIKPAMKAWSVLMPGKARAFAVHDLPAAKAWLTEGYGTAA
jgi:SpoIIAA-like